MRSIGSCRLIILLLIVFDVFIWGQILFFGPGQNAEIYALDVGQGDAEMVVLPGGPKILIDGGPSNKILEDLSSVLRPTDRYFDLIILSHPQTDHFTGFIEILKRYKVGAFIYNGQNGTASSWGDLAVAVNESKVPAVALQEGDKIIFNDNQFDVLSPSRILLKSKDPNLGALVLKLTTPGIKALFTGDINSQIEKELTAKYDLDVDILKVSHHGSKFSSSGEFLAAATPRISLIGVGANNAYGHPAPAVLQKLKTIGSQIFQTDQNGLIKLVLSDTGIKIWDEK